jgi:hypothetical protein
VYSERAPRIGYFGTGNERGEAKRKKNSRHDTSEFFRYEKKKKIKKRKIRFLPARTIENGREVFPSFLPFNRFD